MKTTPVELNGYARVVLTVGWRCNGIDGTHSGTAFGVCSLSEPAVNGPFTPYADLTQDQVLGWVWDNEVDKNAVETLVYEQIQAKLNPPVIELPLPWVTT